MGQFLKNRSTHFSSPQVISKKNSPEPIPASGIGWRIDQPTSCKSNCPEGLKILMLPDGCVLPFGESRIEVVAGLGTRVNSNSVFPEREEHLLDLSLIHI